MQIKTVIFTTLNPAKVIMVLSHFTHQETRVQDFPGGPLVKTPHSQCRGHGFDPRLGN